MTETTANSQCTECGTDVPPDAPLGLCPACLLKRAMQATTAGAGRSAGAWEPPPVEQLAPLFPHLEILEFVGRGGMGAVYKARQPHLDRLVAVKVLPTTVADDPTFAERFAREARALARLSHANIVTVHDFGRAGAFFFFVMEFVDGMNLRQALAAKTLEPRQALAIVPQICDALQYAHDEGIVHRDIKPENVLLDKKGRVKIADFGLAKLLQKTPANYTLTQTYVTMGTPHYMAPEQTERPLEVDHRADIYSLGVVFYEMLTGELPLGRFAPPSQKAAIDARLDEVVFKTLEKDPGRRYQQASEVKTGVAEVTETPPPTTTTTTPTPGASEPVLPYAQHHPDARPHYSRVAWAGLIWGVVGVAALLVPVAIGMIGRAAVILMIPFLLIAFSGVVGMPLCGLIAISQIHRSRGQITGLRLATFDALTFPLLAINLLVIALVPWIVARGMTASPAEALLLAVVVGVPLSALLDILVGRYVWRRVRAGMPDDAPAVATMRSSLGVAAGPARPAPVIAYGEGARYSRTALTGAAWAIIGLLGPLLIAAAYLVRSSAVATAVTPAPAPPAPPPTLIIPPVAKAPRAVPVVPGGPAATTSPEGARGTRPLPGGSSGGGGAITIKPEQLPGAVPGNDPEYLDVQPLIELAEKDLLAARGSTSRPTTRAARGGGGGGGGGYAVARAGGGGGGRGGCGGGGNSANPFSRGGAVTIPPPPVPAPAPAAMPPAVSLAIFPLLAVAFSAPFGATILGLIAISQIRQSAGKLYGMPLAIFDTLVFPLLLLDVLIVGLATSVLTHAGNVGAAANAVALLLAVAAAIAVDVWIVRKVRDAASTGMTVPAAA